MNIVGDTIAGVGLVLSTFWGKRKYDRMKRRDAKEAEQERVAKARAEIEEFSGLESDIKVLKSDIVWIKEQLGKSPNGGGAMEQLLTFVNTANKEFSDIKAWNLRHMELHLTDANGK